MVRPTLEVQRRSDVSGEAPPRARANGEASDAVLRLFRRAAAVAASALYARRSERTRFRDPRSMLVLGSPLESQILVAEQEALSQVGPQCQLQEHAEHPSTRA